MKKLELWFPVRPWVILQGFGENGWWYRLNVNPDLAGHNGMDINGNFLPVRAGHDGICVANYLDKFAGWTVGIKTLEKFEYGGGGAYFKTIYCHFKEQSSIPLGSRVTVGQILGYSDSTGLTTMPHLHFGLKPVLENETDGTLANIEQNNGFFGAIDPAPYFNNHYAEEGLLYYRLIEKLKKLILLLGGNA